MSNLDEETMENFGNEVHSRLPGPPWYQTNPPPMVSIVLLYTETTKLFYIKYSLSLSLFYSILEMSYELLLLYCMV